MPITIGQKPDHGFDAPLGLLSDCHRRIERFLDVLVAIDRDCAGGSIATRERAELGGALAYFAAAARRHTADEEESLFPRLRESRDPTALAALETIARLEREHDDAEYHHAAVDRLVLRWLGDDRLDDNARLELSVHLDALKAIYARHIAIEDGEVFPAAARALSAEQLAAVGGEMAARRRR